MMQFLTTRLGDGVINKIVVAELTVGFIAGAWFVLGWWPRVKPKFNLEAFDAGGWAAVATLVFGYVGAGYLFGYLHHPVTITVAQSIARVSIYGLFTAMLVVRLVHWRRLRRNRLRDLGEQGRRDMEHTDLSPSGESTTRRKT